MRPGRRATGSVGPLFLATLGLAVVPLLFGAGGASASAARPALGMHAANPSATSNPASLLLTTSEYPSPICENGAADCPAETGIARVSLSASLLASPTQTWPNVQVVFVIDTTSYAGDFGTDSVGLDPCAANVGSPTCEESNGIPFFVQNAGLVVSEIQAANPHSKVSFALVDYYDAWGSGWDDQDGPEYHVDIGQFIPASEFPDQVHATFQSVVLGGGWDNWDQDMDNNFLDSSSITALYGAIVGSDLDWSPGAHHVVVWMGVTAPRAPGYQQDYCVSASSWLQWGAPQSCYSQSCEPSYVFPAGSEPQCEGWTVSQDGSPNDSIAGLARSAPSCVDSAGGYCVVDTIDNWATSTDPYSNGWPKDGKPGGGPGGYLVDQNVERVLSAGCAMAAATGGTWDGPSWFTCPNGQAGSLAYAPHGPIDRPNTVNPTLLAAFRRIGFGPVVVPTTLKSADRPIFEFVPGAGISVAARPDWSTHCETPQGNSPDCPTAPSVRVVGGIPSYGFNWSTLPTRNYLATGDLWTVQFSVTAIGLAGPPIPVDACALAACRAAGGGPRAGIFTSADYVLQTTDPAWNGTEVVQSFPLAQLRLEITPSPPVPAPLPAPPPVIPPPPALPVLTPVPIASPVALGLQTPATVAQFQAIAAGFLGAGFARIQVKNKPIANPVLASKQAVSRSKFDGAPMGDGRGTSRWE